MAELTNGKLIFKGEGKNRRRHLVFTTKKGGVWDQPINPDLLSSSLRANTDAEVEVAFETDASGRPFRIRPVGEEWKDAPKPASPPIRREERRGDRHPQRRGQSERREHFQKLSGAFHNPYNFIPAPQRNTNHPTLGDAVEQRLAGHARFIEGMWSGRIGVRLTTQTPLLILDASRAQSYEKEPEHQIFPTRVDAEGKPYLPPTSVKGMLRAAYEAITNSRFGIFEKHQDRLAYRMPAQIGPVPARVENRNGRLGLRLMQANVIGYAAKLPRYREGSRLPRDKGESDAALRYEEKNLLPKDRELPLHGDPVWARIERDGRISGRVIEIRLRTTSQSPHPDWQPGWACITGPNINRKRYERVFLEGAQDRFIPITEKIESLWRELIQNYKDTHARDLEKRKKRGAPQDYLGDSPGDTGWSRHIYEKGAEELNEGTLCYVELEHDQITALLPVTISRRLYDNSPESLLPDSLKPARSLTELSPAERVFGWVNQNGKGAYRGQLRIGPVLCISPEPLASFIKQGESQDRQFGIPLAILGQPKPQQARFYVAQSTRGEAQTGGKTKFEAGYHQGKSLRGRKVYPHHANLPADYWEKPWEDRTQENRQGFFQEYRRPRLFVKDQDRRPPKLDEQRDDQNRSITGWVRPQTTFEFEIDVTNMSSVELGALLWLLALPDGHFHRLGGGKPLGFGSVRLSIDEDRTVLRNGEQWSEFYQTMGIEADEIRASITALRQCVAEFEKSVAEAYGNGRFDQVSFIAAFKRCAEGFADGLPIHYPRAAQTRQQSETKIPPHPEGKIFEWFVANESANRYGEPSVGVSLPDLVSDQGLPILSPSRFHNRQ